MFDINLFYDDQYGFYQKELHHSAKFRSDVRIQVLSGCLPHQLPP